MRLHDFIFIRKHILLSFRPSDYFFNPTRKRVRNQQNMHQCTSRAFRNDAIQRELARSKMEHSHSSTTCTWCVGVTLNPEYFRDNFFWDRERDSISPFALWACVCVCFCPPFWKRCLSFWVVCMVSFTISIMFVPGLGKCYMSDIVN